MAQKLPEQSPNISLSELLKHPENKAIMGEECFQFARIWFRKEVTNPNSDFFSNRVAMFPSAKEVVEIIYRNPYAEHISNIEVAHQNQSKHNDVELVLVILDKFLYSKCEKR